MYRRIEVTDPWNMYTPAGRKLQSQVSKRYGAFHLQLDCLIKLGAVSVAWEMSPSTRRFRDGRAKFFFTEKGWQTYGKHILADLLKAELRVSVIAIKEKVGDVVYSDKYQVALRRRQKKSGI